MKNKMFEFKNKTIEEFRDEVLGFLGKEISLKNGVKRMLESITENGEHYLSSMTGVFEFMPRNGEFDWDKGVKYTKMFGFVIETSITDKRGCKCSNSEKILVPFEERNNKMFLQHFYEGSIIK